MQMHAGPKQCRAAQSMKCTYTTVDHHMWHTAVDSTEAGGEHFAVTPLTSCAGGIPQVPVVGGGGGGAGTWAHVCMGSMNRRVEDRCSQQLPCRAPCMQAKTSSEQHPADVSLERGTTHGTAICVGVKGAGGQREGRQKIRTRTQHTNTPPSPPTPGLANMAVIMSTQHLNSTAVLCPP